MAFGLEAAGRIDRQLAVLLSVQPSLMARAPCPLGVRPIASYSISSATVKQSWVSTKERSDKRDAGLLQRALPGHRAAFELQDVALGHRQEILGVRGGAEVDRLAHGLARSRRRSAPARRRRRRPASSRCASAGRRRTGSSRSRRGRSRSQNPCASARRDWRRRSCGSWRRSSPARRTGRRISGNRPARSCRTRRQSRRRCRRPRADRRPSAGSCRSPAAGRARHLLDADHQHDFRRTGLDARGRPDARRRSRWRRRSRPASPA